MSLPGDLTTSAVVGTYVDSAGVPQRGRITLTPSTILADATGSVVIPPVTRSYTLSAQGTFETDPLVATDCETISPQGWQYEVVLSIAGLQPQSWNILLPASGSPADISGITPVVPQAAVTSYLPVSGGTVSGQLTLAGGLQIPSGASDGDVLTSDPSGNASWQSLASDLPAATSLAQGAVQLASDLGGTATAPHVVATHLAAPLPVNQGGTNSASQNWTGLLTPTATKTTTYPAAAGDLVICDISAGGFTVTLPSAPANLTVVGVKVIAAPSSGINALTVQCGGSDHIDTSSTTSVTLSQLNQSKIFQYVSGIWTTVTGDVSLTQLDNRYVKLYNIRSYGAVCDGATDDTPAWAAAITAASNAGGGTVWHPGGSSLINGSGGVGLTIPGNVSVQGGMTSMNLSTSTPGWTNIIIGSNSLTALFNVTGNAVSIGGFTVTAANSGCAVPVITAQGRARQAYSNIYANNCGGMYLESTSRSTITNCYVQNCNTGYGYYLHNQSLVYCYGLNAGPNGSPAYASLSGVTLTTGFSSGDTVTTLSVSALSAGLTAGSVLVLGALTGDIETAVVSAAALTGATSVSVVSFTALNTVATGQPVQQYTMGYIITGGTCKQWNSNSSAGWAYPKFIFSSGNSYYEDIETNESGQNGVDSLYLNNVNWVTFSSWNNNTGLFNGYQVNMVNGCNFISLTGGGVLGGGLTGIVNIDGTVVAASYISISGLYWHSASAQAGPSLNITGAVSNVAVTGNVIRHNSRPFAVINDQSTVTARGCTYSDNAITGVPGSVTYPFALASYTSGYVQVSGNTGAPNLIQQTRIGKRAVTLTAVSNVYTPAGDFTDVALIASPAANFTIAAPTGTPADGDSLVIRITSGSSAFTPTWTTTTGGYEGSPGLALPSSVTASATDVFGFQYSASSAKWLLLAYMPGFA